MTTCYYCKKEIDLSQGHAVIGFPPLGVSVHDECLARWKKEDPQEFEREGMNPASPLQLEYFLSLENEGEWGKEIEFIKRYLTAIEGGKQ